MKSKHERKKELGKQLAAVRLSHGKTQEDMAAACDVARGTVAHWESGVSNPDLFQIEDWEDYLGEDPIYRLSRYRNPDMYERKDLSVQEIKDDLIRIIRDQAPDIVIRQLHFLASGKHGSNRDAFVQEMNAVLQLPLYMRHSLAVMASSMYKLAKANGILNCPEEVQPDIDFLDAAINAGFTAAESGNTAYSLRDEK